jgi:hypothetical protein
VQAISSGSQNRVCERYVMLMVREDQNLSFTREFL